jgi:hypothetical protein
MVVSASHRRLRQFRSTAAAPTETVFRRNVLHCIGLRSAIRVVDGAVDPVTLAGAQCSGLADRGLHEPGLTLAVFIRLLRQR